MSDTETLPGKAPKPSKKERATAARRSKSDKVADRAKKKAARQAKKPHRFAYQALDATGKKVAGVQAGASAGAVHLALVERGLQPIEVVEKRSILQFEITKKRVPRKEVMNFSRQLSVFVAAGVPIMDALEVIEEETTGAMMKNVILSLIASLRGGDTFAAAAAAHPEAFPNYYVGILESAELTGNLDVVLNQLAEYMERDQKARSKITSALIYPSVVAGMSVVTVVVLAVFVLPRFVTFFASLHAKLPLVTRMLLSTSSWTGRNWWLIALVIVVLVAGTITMRRLSKGREILDTLILRLPVIGDIAQTAVLERTCRILASLLRAGVDMPHSMAVVAESANNTVYRKALEGVREDMLEGQGLAGPITRTGLFPGAAKQMFRVGEETGTLDQQLEVAAEYYGRELETKVDHATSLFEPAVIIAMGVVVGFVAVALISAMYGIYRQVKVG